jgi:hypothetical protein
MNPLDLTTREGHGAHRQAPGDVARVIASLADRVLLAGVAGR